MSQSTLSLLLCGVFPLCSEHRVWSAQSSGGTLPAVEAVPNSSMECPVLCSDRMAAGGGCGDIQRWSAPGRHPPTHCALSRPACSPALAWPPSHCGSPGMATAHPRPCATLLASRLPTPLPPASLSPPVPPRDRCCSPSSEPALVWATQ